MTVAEINALLYFPNHAPDRLERALRIEALPTGWRIRLRPTRSPKKWGVNGERGTSASCGGPAGLAWISVPRRDFD